MTYDDMIQVMDPQGNVNEEAVADISEDLLIRMYRLMVFTRMWNGKALSLQRQGRMGTLASVRGQEASNIGMGLALGPDDWFAPSFREHGAQLARGVSPYKALPILGRRRARHEASGRLKGSPHLYHGGIPFVSRSGHRAGSQDSR